MCNKEQGFYGEPQLRVPDLQKQKGLFYMTHAACINTPLDVMRVTGKCIIIDVVRLSDSYLYTAINKNFRVVDLDDSIPLYKFDIDNNGEVIFEEVV